MQEKTKNHLRCFCSRKPLLATYGLDKRNRCYVHVKHYKQSKVYVDVVITSGVCHIYCRECGRWTVITIKDDGFRSPQTGVPTPSVATERRSSGYGGD